jgi:hypothetical protein
MEVAMRCFRLIVLAGTIVGMPVPTQAAQLTFGPRQEITHHAKGHEAHLSAPAVAVTREGRPLLAWFAPEHHTNHLYLAHVGAEHGQPTRVNPDGLAVDSLHQPPGIAIGSGGEVYLSWSSVKPKPEGTVFASDLRLARSLDGGTTFDHHLQVNEDRPISHSFEGLAVARDGTVLLAWIDGREGKPDPATFLVRITDRGARVDSARKLGEDTCVCCRIDVATGPSGSVAALWRKVFPDNLRDMVLAVSKDGGRSFTPPALVHADGWRIPACPHRGGKARMDARGRIYLAWYTEGRSERPSVLFATSVDGRRFTRPVPLHTSTASIPDHVRLAVDSAGRAVVVWEDSTAVRRRVLLRYTLDGGRSFSPTYSLSKAIKAYAPDLALAADGQFVVAWHEEQFPHTKTIVQRIYLAGKP